MTKYNHIIFTFLILVLHCGVHSQTTKKYGLTPKHPIKVGSSKDGGPANQRKYLELLRDENGNKIKYERQSPCCPYESENGLSGIAMCDKYEIEYKKLNGKKDSKTLYLSFYDYKSPTAPYGFILDTDSIDYILKPELYKANGNEINVIEIKLNFENLTTIPDYVFESINIESLDLSYNKINKISDRIAELKKLKILKLPGNNLKRLPQTITDLNALEEIYLPPGMDWEDTFKKLSKLPNLKRLILWESNMQNIPVSIQEFKKLEELNIKNNPDLNLKKTFETLSSVATLKVLELGISRNIIEIPANINKLKNLEKLYITSTAIETLPEEIGDLENLVLLNLYANRYLELLPLSISNLKKLEIINLESMTSRFNYAISFQHLSLCPNLKKLMLSSTHHIQKFPSEIGSIKSLEYLDISSCTNLIEIPKEIGQLENLKYLDIGASVKIEFIPEEIVNLKNIETLSIGGQVGYSFKIEFEKLSKLPKLSTIIIDWGEQKIPNSIKNFIVLTTLQMNDYQREFITTEERERILELIPNCRIIYNE